MSASDRTEKVLRDIHVLFSKAEPYNGSKRDVIVNKNEMMDLLKELNSCMYDMMDEHELSQTKKDRANREMQKQGDEIIFEATRNAEDIYAASIMYTDNALNEVQQIMEETNKSLLRIFEQTKDKLTEEKRQVKKNQSELKSQLGDLIDTQKYLRLIEDENHRLQKQKESGQADSPSDVPSYANVQPEIRINEDYFRQNGIPLDEEDSSKEEAASSQLSEEEIAAMSADLDREYFDWKDEEDSSHKTEEGKGIFSLFGKK